MSAQKPSVAEIFKNKQRERYAALYERLNDNSGEISFSDAEQWAELLLPVSDGMDAESFLPDCVFTALKHFQCCDISGCNTEEENGIAYIRKVSEITGDKYELVRWHLLAGCLNYRKPENFGNLARRLGREGDPEFVRGLITQIEEIARAERIDRPTEHDVIDMPEEEVIVEPVLAYMRERILTGVNKISYDDALAIIQQFIDCDDEEEIRKYIKYAIREYEDDAWLQNEITGGDEHLDRDVDEGCENILGDEVESVRWLLFSVAGLCRNIPEDKEMLIGLLGSNKEEIEKILAVMEYAAENINIIKDDFGSDEDRPAVTIIDDFATNSMILKFNPEKLFQSANTEFPVYSLN